MSKEKKYEPKMTEVHQRYKQIEYVFLESSKSAREFYKNEEVEDLDQIDTDAIALSTTKKQLNATTKMLNQLRAPKRIADKKYDKAVESRLKSYEQSLNEKQEAIFDAHVVLFSELVEQAFEARDAKELLLVCNMYNSGDFDDVFKMLKEKNKEDDKDTNTNN